MAKMVEKKPEWAEPVVSMPRVETFRIEGVKYTDADVMPDGTLTVSLPVTLLEADHVRIHDALCDWGIPEDRATAYAAEFIQHVGALEMAHQLASRFKLLK